MDFYTSKSIDLCATASAELAADRETSLVKPVPCTSLDKIINTYAPSGGRKIDFLNIDVEGKDRFPRSTNHGQYQSASGVCAGSSQG